MINFYRFEYYHTVTNTYNGIYMATDKWRCKDHTIEYGCPGPIDDSLLKHAIKRSGQGFGM